MQFYAELLQKPLEWISTGEESTYAFSSNNNNPIGEAGDEFPPLFNWLPVQIDNVSHRQNHLEIIRQHGKLIDQVIASPTCCYVEVGQAIDLGDGIEFRIFYRDQQDCVLWAAVGRDVVVAMYRQVNSAQEVLENKDMFVVVEKQGGPERFLRRMLLDSKIWWDNNS
jgi:hypothetical protein